MKYIKIIDWKKFQHYKKRNPPWVKLYSAVLDDDDFDCMPDDSKLLFFCLLPFASRRNNQIRLDFEWLQKKLPIQKPITHSTIQPLIDAGFIECYQDDDSGVIASRKQDAIPEQSRAEQRQRQKKLFSENSDEFRLSELLLNLILERKSDFKKPNLPSWGEHVDKMIRLDNRKPARIDEIIRWCQADDFWQNNILSTAKLRKQFDKLELKEQNEREKATRSKRTGASQAHSRHGRAPGEPAPEFIR